MTNTSYGQSLMRELIQKTISSPFVENYRPDWLLGLELDFYFPGLNLAIEFQGGQHYTPVHGLGNLYSQRRRDTQKRKICSERGIVFLRLEANILEVGLFRAKLKRL